MLKEINKILKKGRLKNGPLASDDSYGLIGAFQIKGPNKMSTLSIISSGDGDESWGWEHVSVSLESRCPKWEEMCFVKDLFWGDDEVVVQFHPAKKQYVNNHPYTLHLWKHQKQEFKLPPAILV